MATAIEERTPGARGALLVAALLGVLLGGILGAAITLAMRPTTGIGAEVTAPRAALEAGRRTDGLRYRGLAEAHMAEVSNVARGRAADALRYQALAASRTLAPDANGTSQELTRGRAADALRYQGLAEARRGRPSG